MSLSVSPTELSALLATDPAPLLFDVRRRAALAEDDVLIAGAAWRDPEAVERWSAELPPGATVVVYCVHGHAVSQRVNVCLLGLGFDARYLEGGIAAWKDAGGALAPKP